jgi:GT2 family glycosyltransferase
MAVSIIIPTRNRKQILRETILSLLQQRLAMGKIEVIVVNDGEEDVADLAGIDPSAIRVLRNSGKGAASARNHGANAASYDLLLFQDDDMLVQPGNAQRHLDVHALYPGSMLSGTWVYSNEVIDNLARAPFGRFKIKYDYKSIKGEETNRIKDSLFVHDSLASFNLSIRKSDFEKLGGFDERFPYAGCEDQDFTMRARTSGIRLIIDESNVCFHNEKDRADRHKWMMRQYTGVQGYALLAERFPERKQWPIYTENKPISSGDTLKVIVKKILKRVLSFSVSLAIVEGVVRFFEKIGMPDRLLFKCYNVLSGLYIFKGFRKGYRNVHAR